VQHNADSYQKTIPAQLLLLKTFSVGMLFVFEGCLKEKAEVSVRLCSIIRLEPCLFL
jgi:hypothetical protein